MNCTKCNGDRFHTKYKNKKRIAWVCDQCRTESTISEEITGYVKETGEEKIDTERKGMKKKLKNKGEKFLDKFNNEGEQ